MVRRQVEVLYAKGHKQSEIARHLGISRQRVHQILTGYKSPANCKCQKCHRIVVKKLLQDVPKRNVPLAAHFMYASKKEQLRMRRKLWAELVD